MLHSNYPQHLHVNVQYSMSAQMTHLIRHVVPEEIRETAKAIDEEIARITLQAYGMPNDTVLDEITKKRMQLPIRHGGGGRRSNAKLCDVAYVSCIADVAPLMINRRIAEGGSTEAPNKAHQTLVEIYGEGAFDPVAVTWSGYYDSGSPYARAFKEALMRIRDDLGLQEIERGEDKGVFTESTLLNFGLAREEASRSLQSQGTRQCEDKWAKQFIT